MDPVWITLIEGILLLAFTIYLVWEYAALKRTPLYVRLLTILSWFLGLAIILFIPLDIYSVKTKPHTHQTIFFINFNFLIFNDMLTQIFVCLV